MSADTGNPFAFRTGSRRGGGAPDAVAQVQYAKRAGWAHVVYRRDPDALCEGIRRMADDMGERQRVATAARRLAKARYAAAVVRRRFRAALKSAAAGITAPKEDAR